MGRPELHIYIILEATQLYRKPVQPFLCNTMAAAQGPVVGIPPLDPTAVDAPAPKEIAQATVNEMEPSTNASTEDTTANSEGPAEPEGIKLGAASTETDTSEPVSTTEKSSNDGKPGKVEETVTLKDVLEKMKKLEKELAGVNEKMTKSAASES